MSRRHINRAAMLESVELYVAMQRATSEAEYQELLARHDACADANGFARLVPRTLRYAVARSRPPVAGIGKYRRRSALDSSKQCRNYL